MALLLASACTSIDPIEDTADSPNLDRSVARWSEPGATPDPRPDAALDGGTLGGDAQASADAASSADAGDASCQLPTLMLTQVSGVQCSFDIQAPAQNVDASLFVVHLNGQLLRAGSMFDYTISSSNRLALRAQACTTYASLDAGIGAVVVSYGTCVNAE